MLRLVLLGLLLAVVAAVPPLGPDQVARLTQVYDAYIGQNLSYECFRYSDHNRVAECDCLACLDAQPDFLQKMCAFREFLETLFGGKKPEKDPSNIWHTICDFDKCPNKPSKCCNPAESPKILSNGCAECLPTTESGSSVGEHASCFLAETDATKKPSGLNWIQRYAAFKDAMEKSELSPKCVSYALVKTAKPCDCEPCLKSEASMEVLRKKFCEYGRLVRANRPLSRPDFWGHNDYFLKFCDFDACPSVPQKCCPPHDGGESREGRYPVDSKGCPSCMPTSTLYGFGPQCQSKFTRLPSNIRDRIVARF